MKALKIIGVILLFVAIGVLGFFLYKSNNNNKLLELDKQSLIGQMNQMQNNFAQTKVETKTIYKYVRNIPSGGEITVDDVAAVEVAAVTYTDAFLTDLSLLPALAMRNCAEGSIVETAFLTHEDYVVDKKFTRELAFENLPMGIMAGDYIDIRYALPNGETYNVLSHIKIEYMEGSTISIRVSEEEWMILDSVMHDATVYGSTTLLYMVRYLDPGADSSIAFYPISTDLATFVQFSPNIKDTTRLINPSLRNHIDEVLTLYSSSQNLQVATAYITGLRTQFAAQVALSNKYIADNTDQETGEVKLDDFLVNKGESITSSDAFYEVVDDALNNIDGTLADFEQVIN